MTPWRTVSRGWMESTGYTRPGTFAIVDRTTFVELPWQFHGRWVVGVWHRSRSVIAGAVPLGGTGLHLTVLASADSPRFAKQIVRLYQDDPETLYTDVWEALDDSWTEPPMNVTRDALAVVLGFVELDEE